ncbi:hypothetical protein RFI_28384 [Reticulomyxa filosa]|uniref:Uncharacterized protein n=1 Tax=Reticulomyxa filosa TaxID=46433 RepID=X6M4U6_RETFI|nr:hypothetical protein RFI_28384 [Reticulomyxa filosa]|eukprot:ETO09003.1 hypothetical protein RFI_28384 [Reticulomyxa filosa]
MVAGYEALEINSINLAEQEEHKDEHNNDDLKEIQSEEREEMEADIDKLIKKKNEGNTKEIKKDMVQPTVNKEAAKATGKLERTATATNQDKPIETSVRDTKQLQKPLHMEYAIIMESTKTCMPNHISDKEGRATASFLHDNSNSDIVSSNLRHIDHVSTTLSILDRFAVLIFTSSKSVRAAMYSDLSTIVQPFCQGSILLGKTVCLFYRILSEYEHSRPKNLTEIGQQVDKFMFEFDWLTALRCKQYKENTPYYMRGWIQTKGEDEFKMIHYLFKFLWKMYRSVDLLNSKELADTYNDQPVPNIYNKERHKEYYQLNNIKDIFALKNHV